MKEEVNLRIEYDLLLNKKLILLLAFYNMGQRPPYVDVLNNRCDRAAICKIHISAHPLMIERGRHLNIPRTETKN
jgi:hypothetical protein